MQRGGGSERSRGAGLDAGPTTPGWPAVLGSPAIVDGEDPTIGSVVATVVPPTDVAGAAVVTGEAVVDGEVVGVDSVVAATSGA